MNAQLMMRFSKPIQAWKPRTSRRLCNTLTGWRRKLFTPRSLWRHEVPGRHGHLPGHGRALMRRALTGCGTRISCRKRARRPESSSHFGEMVAASGSRLPGIVVFRLRSMRPDRVNDYLNRLIHEHQESLGQGAIVSVTEGQIRVRLLPVEAGHKCPPGPTRGPGHVRRTSLSIGYRRGCTLHPQVSAETRRAMQAYTVSLAPWLRLTRGIPLDHGQE